MAFHHGAHSTFKWQALSEEGKFQETFNLCNSSAFENLDNLALLHIDIVWCYFMMKDNSLLSTAGIRLAEARNQFRHLHGEKLTAMHKRELVVYMTLDFLEGHVACCNGNFKQAQQLLTSAQDRYSELQIPDEALVPFLDMGYNEGETRKALRRSLLAASLALQLLEKEKKSEIQSIQTPYFCIFNLKIERGATSDIEGNSVQTTPGQKSGERNHTEEEEISKMEKKLLNNLFEVQFFDRYITLQNEAKLISGFYDWLFNIMRLPTMKSSSS